MEEDLLQILRLLAEAEAKFVLIGGIAARLYGGSLNTEDVDVAIALTEANLLKVCRALQGVNARFRLKDPPVWFDEEKARQVMNNYDLETDLGVLDCLGEVKGVGGYEECLAGSVEVELDDFRMRVLDRETLIRAKEAVGRPKDLQTVAQLRVCEGMESGSAEKE